MNSVIEWLLEDNNPAVKYRTQTELLNIPKNNKEALITLEALKSSELLKSAMTLFDIGKDYSDSHALSALTEYGLTRSDVDIDGYVKRHIENTHFRDGCGEGFLLRNLVKLGYEERNDLKDELPLVLASQQSDGGFPCVSKNPKINKPNVPHKSCFQMTTSYLLLTAEMLKKGMDCPQLDGIIDYFLGHGVIYRHDNPEQVVVGAMGTTCHPPVCTRIGLHMMLLSLSVLGVGNSPSCRRAWETLNKRCGEDGKYILDGSLTKPYVKVAKPGKPDKWVTFYALLADKKRNENAADAV